MALKTTRTVSCCSMSSKGITSGESTFSIEQNGCWSLATASSATEHELFIAPRVVPSPLCDGLFSLGLLYAMWKTEWHLCWCSLSNSTHDKSNVAINVAAQLLNSVHGQTVWGSITGDDKAMIHMTGYERRIYFRNYGPRYSVGGKATGG